MERDFKGVWIPSEVWLDKRLSALDKVIFAEIDSLDTEEKGCFASNDYLSEFCQCSERKVTDSISKLIEFGYVEVESFNGRIRVLRSRVAKSAMQSRKKHYAESQNLRVGIDNINYYNNLNKEKDNSNELSAKRTPNFVPPTVAEVNAYCFETKKPIDAEAFVDFYASKNWYVGKNKMKDWKAAVRNWRRSDEKNGKIYKQSLWDNKDDNLPF